jgi:hypothetical protein
MAEEYSPNSPSPQSSTDAVYHDSEDPPDCIVSMYGGCSDKGRVGQVYPTGWVGTEVKVKARDDMGRGVRKGSSAANNILRSDIRGTQNVRYTERD